MQVEWLRAALRNLDHEAQFIATNNPAAARGMVQSIFSAVALLADQPQLGRPGRIHGTRELIVPNTPYLIPYRVVSNQVQILRIFHTARKPPPRW